MGHTKKKVVGNQKLWTNPLPPKFINVIVEAIIVRMRE